MKKILTFLLTALLAFSVGWATTASVTFSDLYSATTNIDGVTITVDDNVSLVFDKAQGNTPPSYYTGGTSVRMYAKNTLTVNCTQTITSIVITFGSSDGSNAITTDVGTYSNGTWSGSSNSVVFTEGGSSGNRRIAAISVTYDSSTPPTQVATIAAAEGLAANNNNFEFTGNAVVTYQNGNNLWIRDTSGSGLIYGSGVGPFTNGDVLTAGWTATNTTSTQGVPQFESPSGVASSTNSGTEAPEALTTLSTADVNKYASISNITITRSNGSNYYYEVNGNEYCVRDHFGLVTLILGKTYDVIGVVSIYNNAPQLYLISATVVISSDPSIFLSPTSLTISDSGTNNTFTVEASNLVNNEQGNVGVSASSNEFGLSFSSNTNQIESWGFRRDNNGEVNGTVAVNYTGRALSASTTVTASTQGDSKAVTVTYVPDLYIVTDYGHNTDNGYSSNGWDFANGISMTNNNGIYTATFTADLANTYIVFARKLGESDPWNTRYLLGPNSDGNWWLPADGNGNGSIDVDHSNCIKIQEAGTYIITIDATGSTVTFTITKETASDGDFVLVTDAGQLVAGNEVIIVNSGEAGAAKAMSTTQNSNNRGETDVTVAATKKVSATETTQIFTLEGDDNGWYFKTVNGETSGYIYAASSSKNWLRTEETADDNAKALIGIDQIDHAATIVFQGTYSHNRLRYNGNDHLFSCYESSSNQADVFIYQREPSTEPSITVTPASLELVIPPGELTQSGSVTITESNTSGLMRFSIGGNVGTLFSGTLRENTLTITYSGAATQDHPDVATVTLTKGTASTSFQVTGYKLPITLSITPEDGYTFFGDKVHGFIESNVSEAQIQYSFDGENWVNYYNGFTTPEVSAVNRTVTVYARTTYLGETATAQATYTRIEAGSTLYTKVTSADQIQDGLRYIIVFEGNNNAHVQALHGITTGGTGVNVSWETQDSVVEIAGTDVIMFTLHGDASALTLSSNRGYLNPNAPGLTFGPEGTEWSVESYDGGYVLKYGDYMMRWNSAASENGGRFRIYKQNSSGNYSGEPVYLYVQSEGGLALPTFDPPSGIYHESQEVTLDCATEDVIIYYTINGGPTKFYDGPFTVTLDEKHPSATVEAWSYKDEKSSEHVAAFYTFKSDKVYSIQEFLNLDDGDEVYFMNSVVVLFDYSQDCGNGNGQEYIWVQDRTGYLQLVIAPQFDNDSVADPWYCEEYNQFVPKYENGDVIPPGFKVKKGYYPVGEYYQGYYYEKQYSQGQCYEWHDTFQETELQTLADPYQLTLNRLMSEPNYYHNRYLFIKKMKISDIDGLNFKVAADFDGDGIAEHQGGDFVMGYNMFNDPAWKNKWGETIGVTLPTDDRFYNVSFILQKLQDGYKILPIEFTPWEETNLTLQDLAEKGEIGHDYTISNQLLVSTVTWDADRNSFAIFAKDDNLYWNRTEPLDDQKSYMINYLGTDVTNPTTFFFNKYAQEDYDQSNWVEILIPTNVTSKSGDQVNAYVQTLGELEELYEGYILQAGTVTGTYIDALNPTIQMTTLPDVELESRHVPNVYCTANFLMENLKNGALGVDGDYYFMMNPKPHEKCKVVWCYYDKTNGNYFVIPAREGDTINGHGFHGSFKANLSLCQDDRIYIYYDRIGHWIKESDDPDFNGQQFLYNFDAIVRKNPDYDWTHVNGAPRRIRPGIGDFEDPPAYIVYPLIKNLDMLEGAVSVKEVLGNKTIESVHYYNMMGMESKTPFEGINIVVTRYTDGSTSTRKVMK